MLKVSKRESKKFLERGRVRLGGGGGAGTPRGDFVRVSDSTCTRFVGNLNLGGKKKSAQKERERLQERRG